MNDEEKYFRNYKRNPKAIRAYVRSLFDDGHVLEATYYFAFLLSAEPHSIETNTLGFRLAIARFDKDVIRYDRALSKAGASEEEIYSLHLAYYLAFNQKKEILDASICLCDLEFKSVFCINVLIQAIDHLNEFKLVRKFIQCQYHRLQNSPHLDRILKRILIKRFCELLCLNLRQR